MIDELIVRRYDAHTGAVWRELSLSGEYKYRDISGLGPVKSNITLLPNATEAGSQKLAAHSGDRNIVMKVEFNPDYAAGSTVTSLRRKLAEILTPGREVELEFDINTVGLQPYGEDPIGNFFIKGIVETNEPDIFSADPSVSISIICPDPYFDLKNYSGGGGFITGSEYTVEYQGTAPTGFVFSFSVTADSPNGWFLYGRGGDNSYFGIAAPMKEGDRYEVSTVKGDRYARRTRYGSTESMLGYLVGSLNDMRMYPGDNHFEFTVGGISTVRMFDFPIRFDGI